jgi:putative nucleotidyltransferase with HDIG domain
MSAIIKLGKGLQQRLAAVAQRRRGWLRASLGAGTAVVMAGIVIGYGYQPTRISLMSGDPSPETIVAPRAITYIDKQATEDLRERAEKWVVPVVVVRPETIGLAEREITDIFGSLAAPDATVADLSRSFPNLSLKVLEWVRAQRAQKITALAEPTSEIVREAMSQPIPAEQQAVAAARKSVAAAASRLAVPQPARELVAVVAQRVVRPNLGEDVRATQALRIAARRAVGPVTKTYKAGEVILRKGAVASREELEALRALNLLNPIRTPWQIVAIVALCALAVVAFAGYLKRQQPEVYDDDRLLLLTALVAAIALFTINLVNLRGPRAELLSMLSVTAGVMIIAVLVGTRAALMVAVFESLLLGIMAQGQFSLALLTFGSSLAGLLVAAHIWPPSQLVGAGALLGSINIALVLAVNQVAPSQDVVSQAWHALLYGFGAPAIAVGGIFLLQRPFDITTHMRLLELADPNEPLLRRMLVEAPGSYSDSFLVANLAEAAAEAVGADGLLARVGSYYHDIGKLRRPYLFSENQSLLGIGNIHDQLTPSLSSLVITAHVRDGVELAREYRLPRIIRDIVAQHHGTALVSFFYHQARSAPHGEDLSEESFRYPGPKPRTREAAIIMLADATFAAVWSLPDKSPARVEAVVRQIVRERLEDGQLDECPLTLRDLSAIIDAFLRLLKSIIFHTRIEYPQLAEAGARRPGASAHPDNHTQRSRRE